MELDTVQVLLIAMQSTLWRMLAVSYLAIDTFIILHNLHCAGSGVGSHAQQAHQR